jgi:peptidoglycan-associated lipoprotein
MVHRKLLFRNLLIPTMLFLGACCCEKDVVVAPAPPPPPPPAPVVVPGLGDVFYDFDKSALRADAVEQLKTNAAWMQANGTRNVIIEGHCDERGTNEYNLALGERRAASAKDYLVNLGVPANRMKTVSYGEEKPFALGHDEEAWAQNRRAHFVAE